MNGARNGATNGAAKSEEPRTQASNPVARGVELAYRVMDEYLAQGARVAAERRPTFFGTDGGETKLPQLTERMFQYASDFASVWMEAMGVMMRNGATMGTTSSAGGATAPRHAPAPERAETISLAMEVTSRRPVQARLDLRSGLGDAGLIVQDLRSRDPRKPRLRGVVLDGGKAGERKPLTLRLKVANGFPTGEYAGAIVDAATGVTRGMLTVTVGNAPEAGRRRP